MKLQEEGSHVSGCTAQNKPGSTPRSGVTGHTEGGGGTHRCNLPQFFCIPDDAAYVIDARKTKHQTITTRWGKRHRPNERHHMPNMRVGGGGWGLLGGGCCGGIQAKTSPLHYFRTRWCTENWRIVRATLLFAPCVPPRQRSNNLTVTQYSRLIQERVPATTGTGLALLWSHLRLCSFA